MASTGRGAVRADSRWWYWVGVVPVITAFWLLSALWVGVVALAVSDATAGTFGAVVTLPAVALGVPALAAFLVLPLALWQDARAVWAAGSDWPSDPRRYPALAAAADVLLLGGFLLFFEGSAYLRSARSVGTLGLLAGTALGTWVAVRYLRERRNHVEMPGSLREWREELRTA